MSETIADLHLSQKLVQNHLAVQVILWNPDFCA